ncbi:MAG: glycoside hydrolase family 9 protein [Janthinobacterium lividum]
MRLLTIFAGLLALPCLGAAEPSAPVAIHLNQLGFLPGTAKRAIVTDASPRPLHWRLTSEAGVLAAQGETSVVGDDAASGDHVHQLDLSGVRAPGRYRLSVDGATSHPFAIAADVYRPLAHAALNYFYQTRAGIPIEARYAGGPQWARAAGHPHEIAACFKGPDQRGTIWPGCPYTLDVTGGWYDAGDQGKYVVNGGISLWTLQNLYETMQAAPPFPDGSAALPEAGNGVNDLLDEARWEMRFLLAMQVPDGARLMLPVDHQPGSGRLRLSPVDAGGMAHQKVADRNWTPLPTVPAEDREERLLYPPSTAATLNLAATAAQCSRVFRQADPAFARQCLTAAQRAYRAALRNPAVYAAQAFTGSGGYGDDDVADEFYWATAELYAATGSAELRDALHGMALYAAPVTEPGWGSTAALGTITLATAANVPAAEREAARAKLVAAADRFLAEESRSGYHLPYAGLRYSWGSNSTMLNRGMILGLAARFTGQERYHDGAVDTADYVLGRNPLDQSYVSGFGWRPMLHPHHRFWAHQFDPRLPGPPPGVIGGGANNTAFADPMSATLKGKCAPQRCWIDDSRAYADNEVAINWNAPLLWVTTYLDASAR